MLNAIKKNLQDAGWYSSPSFWADLILLAVSFPFLIFPNTIPLITAFVLFAWIVRWLIEIYQGVSLNPSPFTLLILLFAVWLIVPIWVTADPDLTLDKAMGLLLGFLVWRFVKTYIISSETILFLGIATSVLGAAFVGIGFLAVDWLEKIPAISSIVNLFPQQIISFSAIGSGEGVQPNQLAGLLLWLYPFTAGLAIWFWNKKWLFYAVSASLLTFIYIFILILSQSRGGWLGGLAALGIGIWLASFTVPRTNLIRHSQWLVPTVIIISAGLIFLIFGPNTLANLWIDPPDESLVGNLGSLSFRQEVWLWALQSIQDFPITGTGLGTFRVVVQRLYPIAIPVTYDIAHAHNVFLQVALDTGLVGLCLYIALLATFFWKGFKLIRSSSAIYQPIVLGLMASIAGFHFYGLVDTISLGAKPAIIFWLLICMLDRIVMLNTLKA